MELIAVIDTISAKIASLCFTVVLLKMLTKRISFKTADRALMKIHKPAGYILVVSGAIHMVCSVRAITHTSIWVYILGTVSMAAIILAIAAYILKTKLKNWLLWHRIFTLLAVLTMFLHLAMK